MRMRFRVLTPAFLLAAFAVLSLSSTAGKSPTFDESIHLFSGYSHLRWLDFRHDPEHPPLAKVLAALPLLFVRVEERSRPGPGSPASWHSATQMVFRDNDAERLFFYARLPMVLLAVVGGIFVHLWATKLYGKTAGLAALFLFAFDPNFLAHAPLVNTDVALAVFGLVATYCFACLLARLSAWNLVSTAIVFSAAATTKFAVIAFIPVWLVLAAAHAFSDRATIIEIGQSREARSVGEKLLVASLAVVTSVVAAYVVLWAIYGFRFHASPWGEPLKPLLPWGAKGMVGDIAGFAHRANLFPEAIIVGSFNIFSSLARETYLLGVVSESGLWSYFLVAFLTKTPLPVLLLLVTGLFFWRRVRVDDLFVLLPPVLYLMFAVLSGMNLGLRHILPVYPFLFVALGGVAARLWGRGGKAGRAFLLLVALWYAAACAGTYPDYLAYFNEVAGGPRNGHKILVDSNLDWGQDLKGLKRWMDEHGVRKIQLAYFGTADPAYYGINAEYLPGTLFSPYRDDGLRPTHIAVSITYLAGLYVGDRYRHLLAREPVAKIGHSIYVYNLTPKE
jgi:hypothetical protein